MVLIFMGKDYYLEIYHQEYTRGVDQASLSYFYFVLWTKYSFNSIEMPLYFFSFDISCKYCMNRKEEKTKEEKIFFHRFFRPLNGIIDNFPLSEYKNPKKKSEIDFFLGSLKYFFGRFHPSCSVLCRTTFSPSDPSSPATENHENQYDFIIIKKSPKKQVKKCYDICNIL